MFPELNASAWFDPEIVPDGWFDPALISVPILGPLLAVFLAVEPPQVVVAMLRRLRPVRNG